MSTRYRHDPQNQTWQRETRDTTAHLIPNIQNQKDQFEVA